MSRVVISVIGHDRPGLVNDLAKLAADLNLSIEDSRMTVLGGEFAVLMSVAGGDLALQRLETKLDRLATELDLAWLLRRTGERADVEGRVPYTVSVTAMDHPGIVHKVASFFSSRDINNLQPGHRERACGPHGNADLLARHGSGVAARRADRRVARRVLLFL